MKLASIEIIKDISVHPNADKLSIAKILGWQSIVKKDEFKNSDRVVFVVIDTILPNEPWSEFLVNKEKPDKPIRLTTVKLRGQYSQGLVLPLSVLPEDKRDLPDGSDVGEVLGIKKYEKEIPAQLSGEVLGGFPTHICSSTDEDNGLSNPDLVTEVLNHPELTITQKLDGSSCTVIIEEGKISQVCSRRLSLKETDQNSFWRAARKINANYFMEGRTVIQGELMGPGIQDNQLELKDVELYVFQILYCSLLTENYLYHKYHNMSDMCRTIGVKPVPLVYRNLSSKEVNLEWLQNTADSQILPNKKPAEGIVVRPSSYVGIGRPLGFKIINRNYKD